MIREIVLIDFMSHRHTIIEPAAGLTVLVGPNNCGKSAVVAALQILSANSRKDYMIRHGCRECAITVETDDGHTITWRRKGKTVNYTIDGKDVHRLEGDVPEGLHDVLKLAPVDSVEGGETFDVHFARQKEPIFLLNGTGKQAATFFASSSDASRLMAMQQRQREKVREHVQTEKFIAGQVDALKLQLQALTTVSDLQSAIGEGANEYDRLRNQITSIEELESRIRLLLEQGSEAEFAKDRCDALVSLTPPPAMSDTQSLEMLIIHMTTLGTQIASISAHRDVLTHLCTPPGLADTVGLERLCGDYVTELSTQYRESALTDVLHSLSTPPLLAETVDLEHRCRNFVKELVTLAAGTAMTGTLQDLTAPPELQDAIYLTTIVEELEDSINRVAECTTEVEVLTRVEAPPSLIADAALARSIEDFDAAQTLVTSHQDDIVALDLSIQDVRDPIAQWTNSHPTCPTCGGAIDADLVLRGAEAHNHD